MEEEQEIIKGKEQTPVFEGIILLRKMLDLQLTAKVYKNISAEKVVDLIKRIFYYPTDIYIFEQQNGNFTLTCNWREEIGSDKSLQYFAWLSHNPRQVSIGKYYKKTNLDNKNDVLKAFSEEFIRIQYIKKKPSKEEKSITDIQSDFENKLSKYPESLITIDIIKKGFDNMFMNEKTFLLSMEKEEYEQKLLQYYFSFNKYGLEIVNDESINLAIKREMIGITQDSIKDAMKNWLDIKTKAEQKINTIFAREEFKSIKDHVIFEFPFIFFKIENQYLRKEIKTKIAFSLPNRNKVVERNNFTYFVINNEFDYNKTLLQFMPTMTKKQARIQEYIDSIYSITLIKVLIPNATHEDIEKAIKNGTRFKKKRDVWTIYPSEKLNEDTYNVLEKILSSISTNSVFYSSEWKGIISMSNPVILLKNIRFIEWKFENLPKITFDHFPCITLSLEKRYNPRDWDKLKDDMATNKASWIGKFSEFIAPANIRDPKFHDFDIMRQQRAKAKKE